MRLFTLIFLFPCLLKAQTDLFKTNNDSITKLQKLDSLHAKFVKDSARIYRFQVVRPYLNIDHRNSSINGAPVNFKGIQFGIILNENNAMGIGFYGINQNSRKPYATIDGTVSAKKSVTMNYMTFFYLHSFLEKKYLDINIPLEIGIGNYDINFSDTLGYIYKNVRGGIIPIGVGLQFIFKPTRWVGISLLGGYRAVAAARDVKQNFNGAYSSIGLNFDIRQIYRDIHFYGFTRKHYRKEVKALIS